MTFDEAGVPDSNTDIEQVILAMLQERGIGKTICPSEAARRLAARAGSPELWRAWMDQTRATANRMTSCGMIALLQNGKRVDPFTVRGPVRLGLPTRDF